MPDETVLAKLKTLDDSWRQGARRAFHDAENETNEMGAKLVRRMLISAPPP